MGQYSLARHQIYARKHHGNRSTGSTKTFPTEPILAQFVSIKEVVLIKGKGKGNLSGHILCSREVRRESSSGRMYHPSLGRRSVADIVRD